MALPVPKNKWSWGWKCCQGCGTKEKDGNRGHKGKGLCVACWDKKRSKNPVRKAYLRENRLRHYAKIKELPEYKERLKVHQKEWQQKYPNHYKAIYQRSNLRVRFMKFINQQCHSKKYDGAIKFYCEECEKMIQTCILPDKSIDAETSRTGREVRFFKKVHEEFCQKKVYDGSFIKL